MRRVTQEICKPLLAINPLSSSRELTQTSRQSRCSTQGSTFRSRFHPTDHHRSVPTSLPYSVPYHRWSPQLERQIGMRTHHLPLPLLRLP
jgi:hypothetical protein